MYVHEKADLKLPGSKISAPCREVSCFWFWLAVFLTSLLAVPFGNAVELTWDFCFRTGFCQNVQSFHRWAARNALFLSGRVSDERRLLFVRRVINLLQTSLGTTLPTICCCLVFQVEALMLLLNWVTTGSQQCRNYTDWGKCNLPQVTSWWIPCWVREGYACRNRHCFFAAVRVNTLLLKKSRVAKGLYCLHTAQQNRKKNWHLDTQQLSLFECKNVVRDS